MTEGAAGKVMDRLKAAEAEEQDIIANADEIASSNDVEYAYVKAWNGKKVRIQSLTAGDLIEWSEANEEAKQTAGLRLIVKSLVDKDGNTYMTDKHIVMLKKKSHGINEDIVKAILVLNHIRTKQQMDAIKKD